MFTFIFLFFLVLALNFGVSYILKNYLLEISSSYVAQLIRVHASKELTEDDFLIEDPPLVRQKFWFFFQDIQAPNIIRIKVWDRGARIIFSDDATIVGQKFTDNEEFNKAILGETVSEIQEPIKSENKSERSYSQLMEIYVPVFFMESRTPAGVIETYFNLDEINALMARARFFVGLFIFLAIFIYWLTLIFLFRKTAQEPMREMEKYKLAVENASDHIIITDSDGVIMYANKAAEKTTGYSLEEMIGARPSLWGKKMPQEFYEKMWKTIKYDKKVFKGELKNQRKSGENYFAEVTIAPVLDDRGNVIFFVGIERNITKEKELEKTRTDFITLASHQLRTPLSGIKWLIETLQKGVLGELNPKQKEYIDEIYRANEKMIVLVYDMLNVLGLEGMKNIKKEIIDVDSLLKELSDSFEPAAKSKGVEFKHTSSVYGLKIKTSRDFLSTVLECFISNAINYSDAGKKAVLDIKDGPDAIIFSVTDSGIGIPKNEEGRIFERFYRASNAKVMKPDGTGLGLYIAKISAEKIGGSIYFKSEKGKGSTFYLRLPKLGN